MTKALSGKLFTGLLFTALLQNSMGALADLGDSFSDLVYRPVSPCRIFDTRLAGGAIGAKSSRNFLVHGNSNAMFSQGGNSAGCSSPQGEPIAVHLNLTVVPSGGGFITAFPKGSALPLASNLNFGPGQIVANSLTLKTLFNIADSDITVYASATTHVLADVQGYYYAAVPGPRVSGVGYSSPTADVTITDSATVVTTLTTFISAPGHVIVTGSTGVYNLDAGVATRCSITQNSTVFGNVHMWAQFTGGAAQPSLAGTAGFPVSPGFNTFRLLCRRDNAGTNPKSFAAFLTATYSPNRL